MMRSCADGRPLECRYCFYYEKKKGCTQEQCYYLRPEKPKTEDECDGCPYGTYGPCIGWCTREVLQSVRRCAK